MGLLLAFAYGVLAAAHVTEWHCQLIERRIEALRGRVRRRREAARRREA